ncbi:YlzJ-like family protein [Paenibacillus sp. CN-4]|uniref:YlzJ-like family protein n=1 Tax=Paenibacillus nanchangensis TaxID=3348343 RepID=UPI00397B7AA0
MTLHTVMPMEQVWNGAIQVGEFREMKVGGMLMQIAPAGGGKGRIVRLIGCPLHAYLDPSLAPGSLIDCPGTD